MTRSTLLSVIILASLALPMAAATGFDAGFAIGQQQYQNNEDDGKVVTDLELLFRREHFGFHVTGQYADLSAVDGPLIAVHPDLVYRVPVGDFRLMFGGGPSFIRVGSTVTETTWNAEAELARAFRKTDVFVRVRQFDFSIFETRAGESGPDGPVISIGARFRLR